MQGDLTSLRTTARAPRPLRVLIHPLIGSYFAYPQGRGVAGRRLPTPRQSRGAENAPGWLRARPGMCSGTRDPPRVRPQPQLGQEGTAAGRPGVSPRPRWSPPRPVGGAGWRDAPSQPGPRRCHPCRLLWATSVRPPPDGPRGPDLTRHRPSTNTRGSRWQAMVALGRSCRSTSSISQSMKLQSPPPPSASGAPEKGAKGRSLTPGRARVSAASAVSAASPNGGPATPSSIPAPARPRRLRRVRAPDPRALPSAGSAVNPLTIASQPAAVTSAPGDGFCETTQSAAVLRGAPPAQPPGRSSAGFSAEPFKAGPRCYCIPPSQDRRPIKERDSSHVILFPLPSV